ncbi:MAG: response regulator [Candidatus Eremiobacteraeota bacterium]|nr:response regulator [Candidatus Eremiobacteraeota bacterium]
MMTQVLIVEKDAIVASDLSNWLTAGGFEPRIAATSQAALDDLKDHKISILIFSEYPGFDAAKDVQRAAQAAEVRTIVLGTHDNSSSRIAALSFGADCYLGKPFSPREVLARTRALSRPFAYPT